MLRPSRQYCGSGRNGPGYYHMLHAVSFQAVHCQAQRDIQDPIKQTNVDAYELRTVTVTAQPKRPALCRVAYLWNAPVHEG